MDGRLVLLGLIVAIAFVAARDLEPARPTAVLARERAADAVLVEIDRAQLCRLSRRHRYADTVPSLLFTGARFMRTALQNELDIQLETSTDGQAYRQRITGEGVEVLLERRGADLVRVEVGDRATPRLSGGC